MSQIEFGKNGIQVDAALLAKAFRIGTDALRQSMRDGTITSRCERGEGADAGRVRLVFFSSRRRVRITADDSGNVLTCTAVDLVGPPRSGRPEAAGDADHEAAGAASAGAGPDQAAHIDRLLDPALQGTFPASDPIAIDIDAAPQADSSRGEAP
ncbi:hypothetical protein SAMN04488021_11441 [Paracoccus aminovorans]|uniref:Uncharacterized protein n=1 Tax=Paracoccus aminovorans TaxID=34004 RepID=A0A1I3ADE3_9RHOB|nr:DUF6522 family protein [Paracoccus aminovorans]CQR84194.1 hypothetical protein JCM7685_pAMV3p0249 [Paracoccus aminovorans]SFH48078.1 hypothetical protein SAMN04488021_11441 [Paracoccus aminovorans]